MLKLWLIVGLVRPAPSSCYTPPPPKKKKQLSKSWHFCRFVLFFNEWQSRKTRKQTKNTLCQVFTKDIQCCVSNKHSGIQPNWALWQYTQKRILLDAAATSYSHPESEQRPLSLPHSLLLLSIAVPKQSCEWVAYFNANFVYPDWTATEERFRKQFTADLHIKSQDPGRISKAGQACSD